MNKLRDTIRSLPLWSLLVACAVLGVVFGLVVLGWYAFPVQWYDVDPDDLRLEQRNDFLIMAADSYALTDDAQKASQRLNAVRGQRWSDEELTAMLDDLIDELAAQGDVPGADRLAVLAGLQLAQPGPTVTPVPTMMARLKTPFGMALVVGTLLLSAVLLGVVWMRWRAGQGLPKARPRATRKSFRTRREPLEAAMIEESAVEELRPARDIGVLEVGIDRDAARVHADDESLAVAEPEAILEAGLAAVEAEPEAAVVRVPKKPLGQFISEYVKGELDFDSSFGIESPEGEFLGECGMGITDVIGERDGQKVSAFEVWLFDKGDIRTVSKVLVSEYAYRDQTVRAKLSAKGELVVARPGEALQLETVSLKMVAQIVAAEYGEDDSLPPGSFFSRLKVKLIPSLR
jgi:hypothetical protein